MKHESYQTLYLAHLGHVDKEKLVEARAQEKDPFYHNVIDLMLEVKDIRVEWDIKPFTDEFRTAASPRERLDETVFAFLLRLVVINKEERYMRAFQKPESQDAVMAWDAILRALVHCTLGLLYDVRWTAESIFTHLEPGVMKLLTGNDPSALRELMTSVGITLAKDTPYQAERHFQELNFLHVGQYSSFYWRYLHWMAEAFSLRKKGSEFYRKQWLELLSGPLYRTLRCAQCMVHFRNMVKELQPQLTSDQTDFSKLWFDMHNRVHQLRRDAYKFLKEPDYAESEYAEDRSFMLQALSP